MPAQSLMTSKLVGFFVVSIAYVDKEKFSRSNFVQVVTVALKTELY